MTFRFNLNGASSNDFKCFKFGLYIQIYMYLLFCHIISCWIEAQQFVSKPKPIRWGNSLEASIVEVKRHWTWVIKSWCIWPLTRLPPLDTQLIQRSGSLLLRNTKGLKTLRFYSSRFSFCHFVLVARVCWPCAILSSCSSLSDIVSLVRSSWSWVPCVNCVIDSDILWVCVWTLRGESDLWSGVIDPKTSTRAFPVGAQRGLGFKP